MPRLREMLAVSLACAVCLLVSSTSLQAQPAPTPAPVKIAPPPEPSPLLFEPTTPEESFSAAVLMADLARLDLAQKYLEQFDASSPDDETLLRLRSKHGTGAFVRLARIKQLQPQSTQILDKLNAAARKQSEDPAFVDALIARLAADATQREMATVELRNAGPRAVPQILKQMRQPEMIDKQDLLVIALIRMGRQVVPVLLGALDAPEERVRAAVFSVLEALDAKESIPYLWYPAFSEDVPTGVRVAANRALTKMLTPQSDKVNKLSSVTAANELRQLSKMLFEDTSLLPRDENGNVVIWTFDENQQTVVPKIYSPQIASMLLSARFANQSLALSPERADSQRQYLGALLGLEVLQNGWDKPRSSEPGSAVYLAVTAGEETVSSVLADALASRQPSTALAALEVMGQIGTREQVGIRGPKSPVLAALNAPDARVQFAAATAILRIEPRNSFTGSGRVVSILSRALSDSGQPRAVVIDADMTRASQIAGAVADLGYDPIVSSTGRDGFEKAATSAGVEAILVHVNCMRWDLTQTLSNLRADARTAAIPIAIYGKQDTRRDVARLVLRSKPATYITESGSDADFQNQFKPFMAAAQSPPLSARERDQQKVAAAYWLATIASGRAAEVFNVNPAESDLALVAESPDVAVNAMVALSYIGTGSAQRRLKDLAANPSSDVKLRQTAAAQLNYHMQRFGLLLTKDELQEVHSAWESATDSGLKSALAAIIGSLRPGTALVGERLRQFPAPAGR